MKAIILCAGQGRRLLPFTKEEPKCLLSVDGNRSVLELQLRALARCGITQVTIMVGFGADRVERFLATHPITGLNVRTRYNPFFATTNNLITCWSASAEMAEDFVLLNGDTLFDPQVLRLLLTSPEAPVTLVINRKAEYDDDDMKVTLNGGRKLKAVGKTLPRSTVHGESIGLMMFRGIGVPAFRDALDIAIREPEALQMWYLSVINSLCPSSLVETVSMEGLWWAEIDTCEDLAKVRAHFSSRQSQSVRVPQTWERDRLSRS
jgi:choline kinase